MLVVGSAGVCVDTVRGPVLTCAEPPDAAPASADRAQHASSSGPAQSQAGPAGPAHSTAPSGCTPLASKDRESDVRENVILSVLEKGRG